MKEGSPSYAYPNSIDPHEFSAGPETGTKHICWFCGRVSSDDIHAQPEASAFASRVRAAREAARAKRVAEILTTEGLRLATDADNGWEQEFLLWPGYGHKTKLMVDRRDHAN